MTYLLVLTVCSTSFFSARFRSRCIVKIQKDETKTNTTKAKTKIVLPLVRMVWYSSKRSSCLFLFNKKQSVGYLNTTKNKHPSFLFFQPAEFIEKIAKIDRKSTRLNSSHVRISYAVFCLKKKKKQNK